MSGPLAEANLYRFSSKEYHANSRLSYYGFRYYDPNLQRWISQDPLGDVGSAVYLRATVRPNVENQRLAERVVRFKAETDSPADVASLNEWSEVNVNLHGGIGNDPLNQVDPFGLDGSSYADCVERRRNPITEQLPNLIAEKLGHGKRPGNFSSPYVAPAVGTANAIGNKLAGPVRGGVASV